MLRVLAASVVLLALVSTRADADCDPYTREIKIKIPPELKLATTCGNGHIDTYATVCVRRMFGGCGYPTKTSEACTKTEEACDGRSFRGDTCKSFGFAGGSLRCGSSCRRVDYSQCTVCLSSRGCRERAIRYDDFDDFTLLAQGSAIRAFWFDDKSYFVADIDEHGSLGKPRKLAASGPFRLIPTQVGTSALTIVGTENNVQLSVVPATGAPSLVPLQGRWAELFMPILPTSKPDLALAIIGGVFDGNVVLVDAAGQTRPLTAIYAQNPYRRAALIAIAPGKHTIRWANVEADITSEQDDLLFATYDAATSVSVVRKGRAMAYQGAVRTLQGAELKEVLVDGKQVASFGPSEDVIGSDKYPRAAAITSAVKLLAPLVYERNLASIARTSKFEVHAARVSRNSDEPEADNTLAIAVHSLAP